MSPYQKALPLFLGLLQVHLLPFEMISNCCRKERYWVWGNLYKNLMILRTSVIHLRLALSVCLYAIKYFVIYLMCIIL